MMEAFFILPDAEAGDAREDMHISINGRVSVVPAAQVPRMERDIEALRARNDELYAALRGILAEPYGCTMCDSGKLRKAAKAHRPDCPYEIARATIEENRNAST